MSDVHFHSTYNLPLGYQDNHVTLMARDPYMLYAYWEITPSRKNSFIEQFGYQLWEKSAPVLKVTNVSRNSSFYVSINDQTDNWYIEVPDAGSLYVAELGRHVAREFFINLANSNYVNTPNDTVNSNGAAYFIDYRSLKNGSLDLASRSMYETYTTKSHTGFTLGLSSPELVGAGFEQSGLGVSSVELLGMNIAQHFGISSEVLFR